jgi:hypothetical protein
MQFPYVEINMCIALEVEIVTAVIWTNGMIIEYPSEAKNVLQLN